MTEPKTKPSNYQTDYLTLIALSMLAYTLAVGLHEHLGHALTCLSLGGFPTELGAYYISCDYKAMSDLSIRLVAFAGPLVSLVTGAFTLLWLEVLQGKSAALRYWVWLFGTISLMSAAGYLLFSGVSGLGDFGPSRDGLLYLAQPEWLWRVVITVAGTIGYILVIWIALRKMENLIGGEGNAKVALAQKLALTSYLTGGVTAILIGLLNPNGIVVVLISSVASTLGGTSGLAWMMQMLNRKKPASVPPLQVERSWRWIRVGITFTFLYAAILGPTLRP